MRAATVAQVFQGTARAHADSPAIRAHHGGIEWSWDDYRAQASGRAESASGRAEFEQSASERIVERLACTVAVAALARVVCSDLTTKTVAG